MNDIHLYTDFAQSVGRIWATDNNLQARHLPLLMEEKPTIEDCVLHSLVVWHFVRVKYRQVSSSTHRAGTGGVIASSIAECILLPESNYLPQPRCVLGKHKKAVCAGGMK